MQPCVSSQIKAHGHDGTTNTLAIEYHSGDTYHYEGVSPEQYQAFAKAESVGKHFHAHIKGKHKYQKVDR